MSQSQMSDDEDNDCPLCLEEIDISDKYFKPCPCGYQLCRFCWNHIKEDLNGLCPACRRKYNDEDIEFKPVPPEELIRIKNAKKRKERERKEMDMQQRKQLANVRVVQKNLVYVLGLPLKLATEETLRSHDYFGQYGKITKVVVNKRTPTAAPNTHASSPATSHTGVYITYAKKEDASRAIEAVDGTNFEGKIIRATFGTTKYCSYYLKGQPCQNVGCQFLHESGEDAEAYLKDEAKFQRDRGKQIAFAPINRREEDAPAGLPPTANWAKTVTMNSRNFPSLSQTTSDANYEFDSSSERDVHESQEVAPVNDENYPMLESEKPEAKPEPTKKSKKARQEEILGSAALNEDSNEVRQNKRSEYSFGYGLVPRYNGLFDPFGGDKLRNAVLSNLKKSDSFAKHSPPGAFPPRMASNVSGGVAMRQEESNGSSTSQNRKSRYERLFDGNGPAEGFQPNSADSERWNDATRSRSANVNQTYHNAAMYPSQNQQQDYMKIQYQQQMLQNQRLNSDIYGVRRDLQESWDSVGPRSSLNLPSDKPFYSPNLFNFNTTVPQNHQLIPSPNEMNTPFLQSMNYGPFSWQGTQSTYSPMISKLSQISSPGNEKILGVDNNMSPPAPGLVKLPSNDSISSVDAPKPSSKASIKGEALETDSYSDALKDGHQEKVKSKSSQSVVPPKSPVKVQKSPPPAKAPKVTNGKSVDSKNPLETKDKAVTANSASTPTKTTNKKDTVKESSKKMLVDESKAQTKSSPPQEKKVDNVQESDKQENNSVDGESNTSTPVPPKVQRRVLTIVSSKSSLKEEKDESVDSSVNSKTPSPTSEIEKTLPKKMKKKASNSSLSKKSESEAEPVEIVEVEPVLGRKLKKKKLPKIPKKIEQKLKREMNAQNAIIEDICNDPDEEPDTKEIHDETAQMTQESKITANAEKPVSPIVQTFEVEATDKGIVFPGLPDPQMFSNLGVELSLLSTNIANLTQLSQTLSSLASSDGFIDPKICRKCSTQSSNKVSINFNGVENVIDPQEFIDQALSSVLSTAYVLRDGIISQLGQTIELEELERSKRIQLSKAPMSISFDDLYKLFSDISKDIRVVWQNQSELIIEFSYPGEVAEVLERHKAKPFKFQGVPLTLSMDKSSNLPFVFEGNTVETWTSAEWKEKLEMVTEVIENVEGAKKSLNERRFNHVCPDSSGKGSSIDLSHFSENEYLSKLFSSFKERYANIPSPSNVSGTATDQENARKDFDPLEALAAATGVDSARLINLNKTQFSQLISAIQQEFPDPEALLNSLIESQMSRVTLAEPDVYHRIATLENQLEICKREEEEALEKLRAIREHNNPDRLYFYEKMGIRKLPSETSEDEEWIDEDD